MPEQQKRLLADRYELVAPIGRGTMGTVWRARDRALGREVAVKEIRQDPGLTEEQRTELRERMVREGRLAARISHPAVAAIHDVLIHDGSPWIIMELIEARSLEQVIDEEGPLPPRLVAEIGVDLVGALRAAHAQGITHRDVKPANVLITEGGRVVLTDFGIAKSEGDPRLTRTGMVIGSPGYTAPERARGEYTGPESDMWSLGATLYFAVEGRPAYERATVAETLAALLSESTDPPTQAGQLRPALNGLLNKDHRQRLSAAKAETMLRMVADTPTNEMPAMTAEAVRAQEAALPDRNPKPPTTGPYAPRPAGTPYPPAQPTAQPAAQSMGAPSPQRPAQPTGPGQQPPVRQPGQAPAGHGGPPAGHPGAPQRPPAPGPQPGSGPQRVGPPSGPQPGSGPQRVGPPSGPQRVGPQGAPDGGVTVPNMPPPGRPPQGSAPYANPGEAGFDPDRTVHVMRPKFPTPAPQQQQQPARRPEQRPDQRPEQAPRPQAPEGPYAGHGLGTDLFAIAGPPEKESKGSRNGMLLLMGVAAAAAVLIAILIVAFITS
ncbi:serine/threonine-protein kinase [Nonomuraea maritima]|uniref:serine/threonine-protein kinase n=1 Tax=Nonomuraea maritima TaxID=683260 RepID=UPI00371B5EB1